MTADVTLRIQIASIVAILVPILIGATRLRKTTGPEIRLFLLFLVIGFITDCLMFAFVQLERYKYLLTIFNIYSLTESLFFYWFIQRNLMPGSFRTILKILLMITPFFWLSLVAFLSRFLITQAFASQVFDTTYEVCASFLAGYALLKLGENYNAPQARPAFWILLGIFFYCFSTFFIMAFINTLLSLKIWFLNNFVNILTYMFYSAGLWRYNDAVEEEEITT